MWSGDDQLTRSGVSWKDWCLQKKFEGFKSTPPGRSKNSFTMQMDSEGYGTGEVLFTNYALI